ncbi:MAG: hypothetical protein EA383_13775 [Spirochaetaceae bacterium]|nr:MAG: hypothetical protein EA383_13775 [Spirochaetaceae bacterium]
MYTPVSILSRFQHAVERMLLSYPLGDRSGGFVTADGVSSGTHVANARFIAMAAWCYFDPLSAVRGSSRLRDRIEGALEFQVDLVRQTGLIDLESTNWQSPPDTAFTVQLLAPLVDLARLYADVDEADRIRELLLDYVRRAATGIDGGGFHTPNHRWVVCSALAYAQSLIPGLDFSDYTGRILAEGIDINDDGEYSERSTGVYTAVSNRALIIMAERLDKPELLDHVRLSLDFVSRLFQPDGSVVTAMSSRQDRGAKVFPQELADIFLIMGDMDQNDEWIRRADSLVCATDTAEPSPWLPYPWLRSPRLRDRAAAQPPVSLQDAGQTGPGREHEPARTFMADSGLYRVRDGALALTILRDNHDLLNLIWGSLRVHAMRIAGTYFGRMRFEARTMEAISGGVRTAIGAQDFPSVGYYLPVNRPVTLEEIDHIRDERERVGLPQFDLQLDVTEEEDGFRFHLRSSGGMPGVLVQIELCLDTPEAWHTDTAVLYPNPEAEAAVILQNGYGVVRSGHYALRIGPGTDSHRTAYMRGAVASTGWRVTIPLRTPVDYVLSLDPGYFSDAENRFVPRSEAPRL